MPDSKARIGPKPLLKFGGLGAKPPCSEDSFMGDSSSVQSEGSFGCRSTCDVSDHLLRDTIRNYQEFFETHLCFNARETAEVSELVTPQPQCHQQPPHSSQFPLSTQNMRRPIQRTRENLSSPNWRVYQPNCLWKSPPTSPTVTSTTDTS